jgi:hypothetical protein
VNPFFARGARLGKQLLERGAVAGLKQLADCIELLAVAAQLFEMGPDEYFALGDNSPASQDSRLWPNVRRAERRHAVPREVLIGKAFFIYWPRGVPFLNEGRGFPGGPDSILNTPPLRRFFYHRFPHRAPDRIDEVRVETEYPQRRIPFYPNVQRMQRIR